MLDHVDSPYIRAVGFLYLRYTCDPPQLFKWFEPYLFDDEPIQVRASKKNTHRGGGREGDTDHTIGSFVRMLLSSNSRDYCGTMLPRIPIEIERHIQVAVMSAEKLQKRADANFHNKRTMETFQKLGATVMATYEDEENPLTWYRAEVDRVILRGEDGHPLKHPKFVLTFTEYGNTETCTLGEMDIVDGQFYREDQSRVGDRGYGGRDGGRGNDMYDEIRRREQDSAASSGRNFHSRPPGASRSLVAPSRGSSGSAPPSDNIRRSSPPRAAERGRDNRGSERAESNAANDRSSQQPSPPRKRTTEESAAVQQKKRKLMAKYG